MDETTHKWTYTTSSGVMAKNGWMFIGNPYAKNEEGRFSWFKFDANGIMEFGWIKSQNGKWYHTHAVSDGNLGILHKAGTMSQWMESGITWMKRLEQCEMVGFPVGKELLLHRSFFGPGTDLFPERKRLLVL